MYQGKLSDKYCALCGSRVKKLRCESGTYDVKTGKRATDLLVVCLNGGCVGRAPEDLMVVGSRYAKGSK